MTQWTTEPPQLTDEDERVYAAEEEALYTFYDWNADYPDRLPQDEVEAFVRKALKGAGWAFVKLPEIRVDLPDDDWRAANFHVGEDGQYFNFHPMCLNPFTILHEIAHWLRPMDGHGPEFRGANVGLVRAALGEDAASFMLDRYAAFELTVDTSFSSFPPGTDS